MEDLERILKNHKIITDNKVYYEGDILINPPYLMSKKPDKQTNKSNKQQSLCKQTNKSNEQTYYEKYNISQWDIIRPLTNRQADEEILESLKEHFIISGYNIQPYYKSLKPYYSDPVYGSDPKNIYHIKIVDTIGNHLNLINHLIKQKIITRNVLGCYDNIEFRNPHHLGPGRWTKKPDMMLADLINITTGEPY